jgi:hypothetical protein
VRSFLQEYCVYFELLGLIRSSIAIFRLLGNKNLISPAAFLHPKATRGRAAAAGADSAQCATPIARRLVKRRQGRGRRFSSSRGRGGEQSIFRPSHYKLPLRMPTAALGTRRVRTAHTAGYRHASQRQVHHPDSETKEAQGGGADSLCVRRGPGAFHNLAGLRTHPA